MCTYGKGFPIVESNDERTISTNILEFLKHLNCKFHNVTAIYFYCTQYKTTFQQFSSNGQSIYDCVRQKYQVSRQK